MMVILKLIWINLFNNLNIFQFIDIYLRIVHLNCNHKYFKFKLSHKFLIITLFFLMKYTETERLFEYKSRCVRGDLEE